MQNKWGWLIVAASFLIHVTSDGVAYTFGLFFVPIVNEFNATRSATSWISATNSAMTNLAGPLAAEAINKFGCRITSIFGSFLAAFGFAISYYANSVLYLGFTIGLCAGLGMGFIYVPLIVSVNIYFEKKHRSFATGLATCGSGIGTALLAPLVEFLIRRFGWRCALVFIGGIILLCVIFSCTFKPIPATESTPAKENDDDVDAEEIEALDPISYENANEPSPEKDDQLLVNIDASEKQTRHSDKSHHKESRSHSVHHIKLVAEENLFITCSQPALLGVIGSMPSIHSCDDPLKRHTLYTDEEHRLEGRKSHSASISTVGLNKAENVPQTEESRRKCCNCSCPTVIKNTFRTMTDISILKDPDFVVFAVSNFFTNIGYGVPYIYLVDMAVGDSSNPIHSLQDASFLIAIIGGANTVSRVVLGYLGDKAWVNRLCLYIIALIICGTATIIAPHIKVDLNILRVCAATFGATIGVYVSLTSVILVDLFGIKTLNNTFGLLLLFQGVANIIGPPIVGVLCDEYKSYKYGFGFAGGMIVFSGILLIKIVVRRKPKSTTKTIKNLKPLSEAEDSVCPSSVPH